MWRSRCTGKDSHTLKQSYRYCASVLGHPHEITSNTPTSTVYHPYAERSCCSVQGAPLLRPGQLSACNSNVRSEQVPSPTAGSPANSCHTATMLFPLPDFPYQSYKRMMFLCLSCRSMVISPSIRLRSLPLQSTWTAVQRMVTWIGHYGMLQAAHEWRLQLLISGSTMAISSTAYEDTAVLLH